MRFIMLTMVFGLFALPGVRVDAGEKCGSCSNCPRCQEPCFAKVTKGKEKKHCWGVECKAICIPRITFPWQTCAKSCCGNASCDGTCPEAAQCGRVKYVNVLMKHEYECTVCKYSWKADSPKCGGSGSSASRGGSAVQRGETSVYLHLESSPAVVKPRTVKSRSLQNGRRKTSASMKQARKFAAPNSTSGKKTYAEIFASFVK